MLWNAKSALGRFLALLAVAVLLIACQSAPPDATNSSTGATAASPQWLDYIASLDSDELGAYTLVSQRAMNPGAEGGLSISVEGRSYPDLGGKTRFVVMAQWRSGSETNGGTLTVKDGSLVVRQGDTVQVNETLDQTPLEASSWSQPTAVLATELLNLTSVGMDGKHALADTSELVCGTVNLRFEEWSSNEPFKLSACNYFVPANEYADWAESVSTRQ